MTVQVKACAAAPVPVALADRICGGGYGRLLRIGPRALENNGDRDVLGLPVEGILQNLGIRRSPILANHLIGSHDVVRLDVSIDRNAGQHMRSTGCRG